MARRPRVKSPAAGPAAASAAEPHPSPRCAHKYAGGRSHQPRPSQTVSSSLTCRAINGRNLDSGHGQPLRRLRRRVTRQGRNASEGPAKRVDSATAEALPAANRLGYWIVNRSDRAGSFKPPVPRYPDFRSPAETLGRAHFPRLRTEVVTKRSVYPSTYWFKNDFFGLDNWDSLAGATRGAHCAGCGAIRAGRKRAQRRGSTRFLPCAVGSARDLGANALISIRPT